MLAVGAVATNQTVTDTVTVPGGSREMLRAEVVAMRRTPPAPRAAGAVTEERRLAVVGFAGSAGEHGNRSWRFPASPWLVWSLPSVSGM